MSARDLPAILKDTREPDIDAGDAEDAVFTPCIFAPGQPRERPFADRIRLPLSSERVKLPEGDYAIRGARVAFERKSGLDMVATVFGSSGLDSCGKAMHNQDRFRAELVRARDARYDLFAIVSEEQPGWYFTEAKRRWARYGKAFDPFRLQDILMSFLVDLGIPTLYCASRGVAEVQVGTMLARGAGWAEGGKAWERRAREHGYAPRWYAGAMPLAGGDARAQVTAGAEEASDGAGEDVGSGRARESGVHVQGPGGGRTGADRSEHLSGDGGAPPCEGGGRPGSGDVGDGGPGTDHVRAAGVNDDAGEQGAEAGGARNDDGRQGDPVCCPPGARLPEGEAQSMAAAYGAPGDSDGGRGRAPPPEATAGAGEAVGDGRHTSGNRSAGGCDVAGPGVDGVARLPSEGTDSLAAEEEPAGSSGRTVATSSDVCGDPAGIAGTGSASGAAPVGGPVAVGGERVVPALPEEGAGGMSGSRAATLLTAAPVADLPCRCGGLGLGVAGFHYVRAIGCCYGPAPRPCAVVAGQERASLDSSERVAVVALRDRLWRVQRLGVPGALPGFHVEGMVLRYWPVLMREPRRDLLGVAGTSEEHARRRAARERPAPAAKPRRGRAGA